MQIDVILDDQESADGFESAADDDVAAASAQSGTTRGESVRFYKEFEYQYFRLKSMLFTRCPRNSGVGDEQKQILTGPVQMSHTKYPELKLPTFSGKLQDWINFRDNFKSLIHDNNYLNTMDKFNYLRAALKDDALLQINQV